MGGFNWKFWTKNKKDELSDIQILSRELRYAAAGHVNFFQFAQFLEDNDRVDFPERKNKSKIKVHDFYRAIELPESYVLPNFFDLQDLVQKKLVHQLAGTLDGCSATALKSGAIKVKLPLVDIKKCIPGAKWSNPESSYAVISGYAASRMEPYVENNHIGIGGMQFLRELKKNKPFVWWKDYLNPGDVLFIGEVGAQGSIRWMECPDLVCLSNKEAVVFGKNGLIVKEIQPPELRIHEQLIAWYGLIAFAGQNVLHIS